MSVPGDDESGAYVRSGGPAGQSAVRSCVPTV